MSNEETNNDVEMPQQSCTEEHEPMKDYLAKQLEKVLLEEEDDDDDDISGAVRNDGLSTTPPLPPNVSSRQFKKSYISKIKRSYRRPSDHHYYRHSKSDEHEKQFSIFFQVEKYKQEWEDIKSKQSSIEMNVIIFWQLSTIAKKKLTKISTHGKKWRCDTSSASAAASSSAVSVPPPRIPLKIKSIVVKGFEFLEQQLNEYFGMNNIINNQRLNNYETLITFSDGNFLKNKTAHCRPSCGNSICKILFRRKKKTS